MSKDTTTLTIGQRGVITVPKEVRKHYHLEVGDELTLLDLDGVMLLKPSRSDIDELTTRLKRELTQRGESLESMLSAVREERERYGKRS